MHTPEAEKVFAMPRRVLSGTTLGWTLCLLAFSPIAAKAVGDTDSTNMAPALEEIVVTAQKREELLRDVPSSISVLSGSRLEQLDPSSIADVASYVPGLAVQSGGSPGQTSVVIRGIATGNQTVIGGSSLVSMYIDDAPFGSSSGFAAAGANSLDLVPYDIDRVEVLRGPQGTLYGASAMGGVLKYVLHSADANRFEGRIGGDVQHIANSGEPGWGMRAMVNAPLIDGVLGARASGFHRDSAGYIDNVGLGLKGENDYTEDGGRLAVLWLPVEDLKIRASALLQTIDAHGNAAVSFSDSTGRPIYGDHARSTLTPESFEQHIQFYSLTADWNLPFGTLTSASSYSRKRNTTTQDDTEVFGPFIPLLTGGEVAGGLTPFAITTRLRKFTQELRLASSSDRALRWLLGAFYTDENALNLQELPALTLVGDPVPGINPLLGVVWPTSYKEYAIFANATYRFNERLDLTAGLRYARNKQIYHLEVDGPLVGGFSVQDANSQESVVTWMASPQWHLNKTSMLYARAATGYRPGGPNVAALGVPPSYKADRLTSYEGGFKADALNGDLQIDLSVFYIDWKDIQIDITNAQGISYPGNGSGASSSGSELTLNYRLFEGLRLGATLAYTDAHLTQDAESIQGKKGDRLPMSPRWNGSVTAEYQHNLDDHRSFVLGGGYRYVGTVNNYLESAPKREPMGPQNITDLYASFTVNRVTGQIFARNVFNNRSYSSLLSRDFVVRPQFVPVQPRTIGLSVDVRF